MQNILVTGSAGFIGFHTVLMLIKQGYSVTGIDNLNNYYSQSLKINRLKQSGINKIDHTCSPVQSTLYEGYRFIQLDLTDGTNLNQLFKDNRFDGIIHLAAQPGARYSVKNPDSYITNNIVGFFNLLEASRTTDISHIVYASSSSVYGDSDDIPYSENQMVDQPVSLYAATKKSNELMAYSYSSLYHIPMTGLRFFTVYGPWGRPDMVYFKYTKSILEGKPIKVYNFGKMKRDFTFIDDIVKGVTDVLKIIPNKKEPHQIFNIGNSDPVELLHFIKVLENILGKKARKEFLPMQKGDVLTTFSDTSKLEKYCGYKPYTSLKKGLNSFTEWYLQNY